MNIPTKYIYIYINNSTIKLNISLYLHVRDQIQYSTMSLKNSV